MDASRSSISPQASSAALFKPKMVQRPIALGASGAIFGIFVRRDSILLRRRALGPAANGIIGQWFFFLLINIFFSLQPGIGGLDHFGGLGAGLVLGALFTANVGRRRRA